MPIRTLLLGVVAVEALSLVLELPQATSRAEAARARTVVRPDLLGIVGFITVEASNRFASVPRHPARAPAMS